jgi:hypothetical protein
VTGPPEALWIEELKSHEAVRVVTASVVAKLDPQRCGPHRDVKGVRAIGLPVVTPERARDFEEIHRASVCHDREPSRRDSDANAATGKIARETERKARAVHD